MVGRQVHLEIGDEDFYLDPLFYHLELRRYVVIELKARKFQPGDGAQLGMYMTAVDRLLCHPNEKPTLACCYCAEELCDGRVRKYEGGNVNVLDNPLNPIDKYSSDVPFAPLEGGTMVIGNRKQTRDCKR